MNWDYFYEKKILKKSLTMPKKLKGRTLWDFSTSILLQNSRKLKWAFRGKKVFLKKSYSAEKMGPLVSSGIVCYAGSLFGSVPWANRYILASSENFVELLVELFWSVQVVFKKTLTKSHDYSRLSSKEKRRLKNTKNSFKQFPLGKPLCL